MNLLLVPVQEFFNMSQILVSLEMLCMVDANDSVPILILAHLNIQEMRACQLAKSGGRM